MRGIFDLPTDHIFEYWNDEDPSTIWVGIREGNSMRMIEWNGDGYWASLDTMEPLMSLPNPTNFVDHGKACDDLRRV